jgi:hypothetical protein
VNGKASWTRRLAGALLWSERLDEPAIRELARDFQPVATT